MSLIFCSGMLIFFGWITHRQPVLLFGCLFLLVSFLLRMISIAYLDVYGPVYAEELEREIGNGNAVIPYGIAILLTLLPVVFVLQPGRWSVSPPLVRKTDIGEQLYNITLGDLALIVFGLVVVLLYGDMFWRGVIPLFAQMERFEYSRDYAGPLHKLLFEHGPLMAMWCGIFCVYPALRGGRLDFRFVGLLGTLFVYAVLTGHRFSAFYSFTSMFLLPFASLVAQRQQIHYLRKIGSFKFTHFKRLRIVLVLGVGAVLAVIVFSLSNSYLNVRGFSAEEAWDKLVQRLFVQPGELWWITWEWFIQEGGWDSDDALKFMFNDPIDPNRNTGIQYLMVLALGYGRASEIIGMGSQYAGGFPEIFFWLLGPVFSYPVILLLGFVLAFVLRILLGAICRGHFLTAFWAGYVFFAVCLIYIGGMLNFVIASTFWVKVLGLVISLTIERGLETMGTRLLPWQLLLGAKRPLRKHK